ncbi:MAG: rod shape-determining protein RodA, partial [Bacteroidales bacterium]|nr:rod shape-determining protein RodA [Bacteroidales bacterium]
LSGWFLAVIGIAILLFILTLTASPFTAVLVLLSLLVLFNAFNGRFWRTILLGGIPILLLALIPAIRRALVPGAEGGIPYFRYIIAGLSVVAIPILLVRAYKIKSRFLTLSVAGFIAGIMMIMSADIIFNDVLQEHQRKRIEVLLGMKEDPSGVGYNVNQSMIAIGSGGLTGKGYLNGTQTTYGFVPEQSTDFIFCTVGEEWGFLGCTVVILLYFLLIWRIVQDAEHSREAFTRIYGYCVASCLFMHLFINIGMTIGLMPVIGIPLPMMSYGGSSLWAFTVMIFIFVALDHEERKYF